jgi:aldose 1-epimerase
MTIHTLVNKGGAEARIADYGATLMALKTRDRNGVLGDIVLGFESVEPYLAGTPNFGAIVGRYANRIAGARFTLDGMTYRLPRNDGDNCLHGGKGFDKRVWQSVAFEDAEGQGVTLTYVCADGEEGFPGTLTVQVTYRLRHDDALSIRYQATTTKATPINVTNHSYFNLSAGKTDDVLDHRLTIAAECFTPVDAGLIPTGELRPVAGTPFDFRRPETVGSRIAAEDEQIRFGCGYDHNFVMLGARAGKLALAAILTDPLSGRVLEVRTTEPGVQIYTGNCLDGAPIGGRNFARHGGICLETQHFPDSPNQPAFPATILRPGEIFTSQTDFAFRTADAP